jgi:hypothetical protein
MIGGRDGRRGEERVAGAAARELNKTLEERARRRDRRAAREIAEARRRPVEAEGGGGGDGERGEGGGARSEAGRRGKIVAARDARSEGDARGFADAIEEG